MESTVHKRIARLLLSTLCCSSAAYAQWPERAGPEPSTPDALSIPSFQDGQIVAPLARVTLFVRDMERSLAFYRDILRLEVVHDETVESESINKFLNIENAKLRMVILTPSGSTIGNVGLYEIIGAKETAGPPSRDNFGHTGDFALVFRTNDIQGIYEDAAAAGTAMMNPPVTLMSQPNMKQQPLEMSLRDPDGFMVNITQAGVPE